MISKYIYGEPFNTEATVKFVEPSTSEIKYLQFSGNEFVLDLLENDIVYGLGEQIRGINKRGWKYVNWNYDNPHHHEDTNSLYGSHNFLIVRSSNLFGVFFDYPGKITFDIGYTDRSKMIIHPATTDLDVYIIEGTSEKDIVKQFRELIGMSYVPPMWAFGYGQSRWGYKNEEDVRTVALKYEEAGIPLDSIYLDIDYMERYKDFTVNPDRFRDMKGLATEMKAKGVHLVPIIDAGVKIEPGYDVYEEGVRKGYFCKNEAGEDFVGAVWPGKVHFPDFLTPEARAWFGSKYEVLTSLGIDGFWNDMNEPAIFYSEDLLEDAINKIGELNNGNMGIDEFFAMTDMIGGLNGNEAYYEKFYHCIDGKMVKHSDVHNLYGFNMTRSANEALNLIEPDRRTLFFSRSSYIGAHRYGGIWQGDNKSWWSHILQAMQQLPALNMAGFMFVGADTGGFGCDTTEDLMLRWLQYSMFTPLFRNHSCNGTRFQELYQFKTVEAMKNMIDIRYRLIPYLYSEFLKATFGNEMMFRPVGFDYPDDRNALNVDDQLFLGNELMIAPIYKQNANGRYVYLPEEMMLVRMSSANEICTEIMPKGHHYIDVSLYELVFFIRSGKSIPMCDVASHTSELDFDTITMVGYGSSRYVLYKDDGISSDLSKTLEKIEYKN